MTKRLIHPIKDFPPSLSDTHTRIHTHTQEEHTPSLPYFFNQHGAINGSGVAGGLDHMTQVLCEGHGRAN